MVIDSFVLNSNYPSLQNTQRSQRHVYGGQMGQTHRQQMEVKVQGGSTSSPNSRGVKGHAQSQGRVTTNTQPKGERIALSKGDLKFLSISLSIHNELIIELKSEVCNSF